MACSTCMGIRRAINSSVLAPLGLPQLPVQTSALPTPIASPVQPPTNPAWPTRR
jgi:hypothetical protein